MQRGDKESAAEGQDVRKTLPLAEDGGRAKSQGEWAALKAGEGQEIGPPSACPGRKVVLSLACPW